MIRQNLNVHFLLPILLLAAGSLHAQSRLVTGKVVAVSDGDTITVLDGAKRQHKVRLAGIDAPESSQDFGTRSKHHLSSLVFGKFVIVVGDKIDHYGRRVGKVVVGGVDANLEQVRAGYAWHYKQYQGEQTAADRAAYSVAEREARAAKRNIWSVPDPTPPWEYRNPKPAAVSNGFEGAIIGNKNSRIYHRPGCPSYGKLSPRNRVLFKTAADAEAAGYRMARNCK